MLEYLCMKKLIKKLVVVFAVLFLTAAFIPSNAACGPGQVITVGLIDPIPWSAGTHQIYERSVFEVRRYRNSIYDGEFVRELINNPDESSVSYILRQGYSLEFPGELNSSLVPASLRGTNARNNIPRVVPNQDHTLIQMYLEVIYDEDEGEIQRAERIISYTVFETNCLNLSPVFSFRWAEMNNTLGQGGRQSNGSHQLWADYRTSDRQAFLVYYSDINEISFNTRSIANASGVCNEYLFFLLRALNSTSAGGQQSIDFFLPLNDLMADNRIRPMSITQVTDAGRHPLRRYGAEGRATSKWYGVGGYSSRTDFNNFIKGHFVVPDNVLYRDGGVAIEHPSIATRTTLRLDGNRRGTDIELYFSAFETSDHPYNPGMSDFALRKVLLQVVTHSHVSGSSFYADFPIYTQVFSLVEYINRGV